MKLVPSTPKVDWAELSDDEGALTEQLGYNGASFAETAPPSSSCIAAVAADPS